MTVVIAAFRSFTHGTFVELAIATKSERESRDPIVCLINLGRESTFRCRPLGKIFATNGGRSLP